MRDFQEKRHDENGYPQAKKTANDQGLLAFSPEPTEGLVGLTWIQTTADGCVVKARVIPRASKNQIQGALGDALKIRLQAPPVDGKANEALVRFLAEILKWPARKISLLSGETGRTKRILLSGMKAATACMRLKITDPPQAP